MGFEDPSIKSARDDEEQTFGADRMVEDDEAV